MGSLGTSGSDSGFAFQCMTAEDKPILVDGQPVMVVDPADCHQYYLQHLDPTIGWVEQPGGYPAPIVEPPPPVFLEAAKMRFQSDDQDLDDRVIRQLWEDNKELREEVTQLRKNTGDDADEAMAAILRDRINDLLTANADLEREVAKLRYADAARGAAESVETLDKLRQTRDTLNDILTENDQLKIEEDLHTPWPSKRHEELKTEDDQPGRDGAKRKTKDDNDKDNDDDDDDIKNSSMDNLSKYLAGLVGNFGNKIITKSGNVDWTIAKKFIKGLKTDLGSKFDTAGRLAKEEIDLVVEKFDDLRNFVDSEGVQEHMQATRVAAAKLVKSLVGSVASLKEASEDAAEKTDWASKFEREAAKMKSSLEKRWGEIRGKWEQAVRENEEDEEDEEDDDEGYTSDDNDDDEEDKEKYKKSQKDKYKDDNDDDDKEDEDKKYRKKQKRKEEKDDEDDDDDDGYKSSDDKHERKKHKKEKRREHKKRDDDDYDYRS